MVDSPRINNEGIFTITSMFDYANLCFPLTIMYCVKITFKFHFLNHPDIKITFKTVKFNIKIILSNLKG